MNRLAAFYRNLRAVLVAALAGAGTAAGGAPQAQAQLDSETAAWEAARATGTADAYQDYLEQYPTGRYAEEAFRLIIEQTLGAAAEGTAPAGSFDLY